MRGGFFTDGFHLFYGNPFSPDPNTAHIFFQPQFLVLGTMQALTGADPGTIFVVFGFVAALVWARVAIALYEEIAGADRPGAGLGLILFFWGGGVLVFTGLIYTR